MANEFIKSIAQTPCGELTAIEHFAFTRYCENHLEEVKNMLTEICINAEILENIDEPQVTEVVYGLQGIAEIFGCSCVTAQKIKKSGLIDGAITQIGRKIVTDVRLARQLVREHGAEYGFNRLAKV